MKRRVGLLLVLGAVLPLAIASTAWACGVLATLKLDSRAVSPGDTISATGRNYGAPGSSGNPGAVTLRLGSRTGKVVATTSATASNAISATFKVPADTDPGWYTVTATQFKEDGTPKAGTPGRTSLRVGGATASQAVAPPWASAPPTGAHGGGTNPVPLPMILAVALSLSLLLTGSVLVGRRNHAPRAPLGA